MIVDDQAVIRDRLRALFEDEDLRVSDASDGAEAVQKAQREKPNLIILDLSMPVMNGLDFVRAIRAKDSTKQVPVLMVTTNAAQDDILEALKAGVNDYVVKPFTPDVIKAKVQAVTTK